MPILLDPRLQKGVPLLFRWIATVFDCRWADPKDVASSWRPKDNTGCEPIIPKLPRMNPWAFSTESSNSGHSFKVQNIVFRTRNSRFIRPADGRNGNRVVENIRMKKGARCGAPLVVNRSVDHSSDSATKRGSPARRTSSRRDLRPASRASSIRSSRSAMPSILL